MPPGHWAFLGLSEVVQETDLHETRFPSIRYLPYEI